MTTTNNGALTISRSRAALKIALYQARADSVDSSDLYIWIRERGFSSEVAARLCDLISTTKRLGKKVIHIGKIILIQLIDFAKQHPNLVTGVTLGAAVGIFASSLISAVPFIGPILAPLVVALGVVVGGVAGHRLDKGANGLNHRDNGYIEIAQDLIQIVQSFFKLFFDTMRALAQDFVAS